jgi:hypothetical protein
LHQQTKIKDERIEALQSTIEDMQRHMAQIAEVLAMKPRVEAVEQALKRKGER